AGILAVGVAVAGCGGGPSTPGAATGSKTTTTGLFAYSSCMRSHGVRNFPDPTSSEGIPKESPQQLGISNSRFVAAQKDCINVLPAGESLGGPSGPSAATGSSTTGPASGPLLPTADPFYRWSGSLAHDTPGTILRTRALAVDEAGGPATPVKATQLLYVTTDELGSRTVSVVSVLQPLNEVASAATRLVSYQNPYDALGAKCDPSYTLQVGTEGQLPLALRYVEAGDTVVISDYEGEDLAEGVGQQYGYETLDAIRAAEKWLGVPENTTPVGMVGYSGGSIATEFASELAPHYAPDLDIVGVAEGGVPVDPFHNLAYVDHPGSSWTWVIPVHLKGVARAFDIRDLDKYLTPRGIAAIEADQTACVGGFTGLTTEQMFKAPYRDIEKVPVFVRIFDRLIMSRSGTPRSPLFIGVGQSDPTGDTVIVTKDVQELAYTYCHRGVAVEFHVYDGLDHDQAGLPFLEQAQAFLTQRFENLPFQNGCGDIGPGNSIAPVPAPAS
ncbi:MAG: lipase family protein, partial [Nitrososphaerales archaeon]